MHLGGVALLHDVAVDPGGDVQRVGVQVGFNPGAERGGAVEALGAGPLAVFEQVAGGEVVGHGVAEDDLVHALERHGLGDTTDNDGEFTLGADGLGVLGQAHGVAGANHGGVRLEEELRGGRRLGSCPVCDRSNHLGAGNDRGEQTHLIDGVGRAGRFDARVEGVAGDDTQGLFARFAFDQPEMELIIYGKSCNTHTF